ncbi:hypothetical protein WA171_002932, partial [Blastocystis sp. BT1]
MDHIEQLANLKHQLSTEIHKLETTVEGNVQIDEQHDRVCQMEKEMEDTINDCIDFYEIELPEIESFRSALRDFRLRSRKAWSTIQQRRKNEQIRTERDLLLQKSSERVKVMDSKQVSSEITNSLRHTMQLLSQNEEKMLNSGTVLEQDNSSIHKTNAVLHDYSNTMNHSSTVIKQMKKREEFEKRFLYFAIIFLVITVVVIVIQRLYGSITNPVRRLVRAGSSFLKTV